MYTDEGSIRGIYLCAGIVAIGTLCSASVALAGIISGSVATAQSGNVKTTQLTINEPASVRPGDLLLANIAIDGGSEVDIHAPTGWTQLLRTDNDSDLSIISYWKIASSSEQSGYTWSVENQTHAEGGITAYNGIDQANPIDTATGNSGYGTTATTTQAALSSANEEVVTLYAVAAGKKANAGAYFSVPAGMNEKYDVSNTPFGPSIASDDMLQSSAGTTSRASTIPGKKPRNWVSQLIALRTAASTGQSGQSGQIAFDSSSLGDYQEGSATRTWSHTVSGTSTALIVCGATYNTDFTGATYDGVPMTLLTDISASEYGSNTFIACYGLLSPHVGTHDIMLSRSGTFLWLMGEAESFSGVSQADFPDSLSADHQSLANPYIGSIRTKAKNAWGLLFSFRGMEGKLTGLNGVAIRESNSTGNMSMSDSNGPWTLAADHALSVLASASSSWDSILISLAPSN